MKTIFILVIFIFISLATADEDEAFRLSLTTTESKTTERMTTKAPPSTFPTYSEGSTQSTTKPEIPITTLPYKTTTPTSSYDDLQQQVDDLDSEVAAIQEEMQQNENYINSTYIEVQQELQSLENRVSALESLLNSILPNNTNVRQTCQSYYDEGIRKSGYYTIDPDGSSGATPPFQVYCDMTSISGAGITQLSHDSENRTLVNGCENPGCYEKKVTYDNTMQQVVSLLSVSSSCRQYIKYECHNSMMFHYDLEAHWNSRDNVPQYYWGGADPESEMCGCGKNNTCNGTTTCNCDNNDDVWRLDDGYLTDLGTLPVTLLAFGDTEAINERGYHTLGKLECWGLSLSRTCADLKREGKPSGNYTINPDPSSVESFDAYCDMEAYPGTGVTVIHHNREGNNYLSDTDYVYVTYDVNMTQIVALIDSSDYCSQRISWQCYHTGFLNYGSYWASRDGVPMNYWGGAKPNHDGYCACGEIGTCLSGYSYSCNCDYVGGPYIDAGYLEDPATIPVSEMYYYMSHSDGYGYYELGPLECY